MLYQRWREIAQEHRRSEALREVATGQRWSFGELFDAGERGLNAPSGPASSVTFPQGHSAGFILEILHAWKLGQVVCPLELSQGAPLLREEIPSGIVHLKTTSATTGAPRFVAFTAEQLAADANNIVATMGLRSDWPNLAAISLAHSYGFSNLVLPLLLHGIPLVLATSPLPEMLLQAARGADAWTLPGVPALWRAWHEAGSIPPGVRLAISAGAPLSVMLETDIFRQHGLKVHNFYGSTECGGIAFDRSEMPRADGSLLGAPLKNVELSVGSEGCLEVRSSAVATSYWPTADEGLSGGVFRTTDVADLRDGLAYIRGRASDLINVAGRKVAPESVEQVLALHPAVQECLVFGVPSESEQRGEEVVACIVKREEVAMSTLRQWVLERLPAWQVPRDWWELEALPVNERGKRSRVEWRRRYLLERR